MSQTDRGSLAVTLASDSSYGRIQAATAALNGLLTVTATYTPAAGNQYNIITANSRAGTFSGFNSPPPPPNYSLGYTATTATVSTS